MSKFPVASKPLARFLQKGCQTIIRLIMAASRLQFSCNRMNRRARRRLVSLPPWRCCLVIYAQVPAASRTFVWPFTRLPDENSSGHGRDSSADLLQMDQTEGDMVNCRHSSWAMLLAYIISKLTVAPKPLAQPSL